MSERRPILLDLFSGAGGASAGYRDAGFDVVGVDLARQPRYPFPFLRADALAVLDRLLAGDEFPFGDRLVSLNRIAAIHASPPCQGYSSHVSSKSSRWAGTAGQDEPRLIIPVFERLVRSGKPWVIENVDSPRVRAELRNPVLLCGVMFGRPLPRHRLFETSIRPVDLQPFHVPCRGVAKAYAEERGWNPRDMSVTGKGREAGTADRWREILDWPADVPATQHGLRESVPPAYTRHVGAALLAAIRKEGSQ